MKILYWTPEFYPDIGGIEVLSTKVLPIFRERNYDFLVVTSHGRQRSPDFSFFNGIPVHRFHFREALGKRDPKRILLYQKQVARLKKAFNPDLVHFHFGDPYGYFQVTTADSYPTPTLVTLHMSVADYNVEKDTMIHKLLRKARWVVGVSKSTLTDARRVVPTILKRSSVIYNGLDFPELDPEPLNFDEPRILCLGRMVREKGFDLAIAAFADIKKKFPGSRLILAGDGLARVDLERQTAALGLTEFVDFLGWVDPEDVSVLINQATIVILPSRWREPFPLVALQAAQMARPVVASRVGGLPEFVVHQNTGLLVEREAPQQLAGAITYLLEHPDISERYGLSARERTREAFSLSRYVDSYDQLYKSCLDSGIDKKGYEFV